MDRDVRARRGALVVGVLLVVFGVAFLVLPAFRIDISLGNVGWPLFVIVPGVILFLAAFAVGGDGGAGFAVAGSIVTTVGLILAYQAATGHYESWAYAWALVAPTSVGVGLVAYGMVQGLPDMVRGGAWAAGVGLSIFLVGVLFFEGVLGLGGPEVRNAVGAIVPLLLVALGLLIVVGALRPRPRR